MPRYAGLLVLGAALQIAPPGNPVVADESPLPKAGYGISTVWQIGGTAAWESLALDPSGTRLFVSRGDHVDVLETAGGKRQGSVSDTAGVRGIAFAPELKRGFTSNGRANTVTAFELDTLRIIKESTVAGKKPDAIVYEPRAQHVFAADGSSNDVNALDPLTLQALAVIDLPGPPGLMATDAAGTVFVNISGDPGRLVAIDAKTLKVRSNWALPGCANPTGIAIDTPHHRLFSVCANQVMAVTDAVSGRPVTRVAIGDGPDSAAFDADLGFVFSANGNDGTLTVIHQESPDEYRVIATIQTQKSARTMALDPASHRIFLAAARFGATPPATPDQPNPRPAILPASFVILVAAPK